MLDVRDLEIRLQGYHCRLDESSSLYEQLKDIFEWIFITIHDQDPNFTQSARDAWTVGLFKENRSFGNDIKNIIREHLSIDVLDVKVQTWIDHQFVKTIIGIAVQLDQEQIDRFDAMSKQQMINSIIEGVDDV